MQVWAFLFEPVSSRYKLPCAPSEDLNQSVHPHSLISILVYIGPLATHRAIVEDSVQPAHNYVQADLSLQWVYMPTFTFAGLQLICVC